MFNKTVWYLFKRFHQLGVDDNAPVDETFEVTEINPDETVATVLCSSGTTGLPKGVMTTHVNMTFFIEVIRYDFNAN